MASGQVLRLLSHNCAAQGVAETKEDRARDRERSRAANDYEELDSKKTDRHWSEKGRGEMTERDWRIFREDFSISYKGNTGGTLPLRNWQEAGFPESIMKVCTPFTCLARASLPMPCAAGAQRPCRESSGSQTGGY